MIHRDSVYETGFETVPGVCLTVTVADLTPLMSVEYTSRL
jgi:hypothetical protein